MTKMNLRSISSNFGVIEVFSRGMLWTVFPLLSLFLTAKEIGILSEFIVIIAIVHSLLLFGQSRYLLQTHRVRLNALISSIYLNILLLLIGLCINLYIQLNPYIFVASFLICIVLITQSYMRGESKINSFLVLKICLTFLKFIFSSVIVLIIFDVKQYPISEIMVYFISIICVLFWNREHLYNLDFKIFYPNPKLILSAARFGVPFFGITILQMFSQHSDKLFVTSKFGAEPLGNYYTVYAICSATGFIASYFAMNREVKIYEESSVNIMLSNTKRYIIEQTICIFCYYPIALAFYFLIVNINNSINFDVWLFTVLFLSSAVISTSIPISFALTRINKSKNILICVSIGSVVLFCGYTIISIDSMHNLAYLLLVSNISSLLFGVSSLVKGVNTSYVH